MFHDLLKLIYDRMLGGVSSPLGRPPRNQEIVSCRACVRARGAYAKESDGLGVGQVCFLQMISGRSSHKKVRTVPAKIKDSDGLGLGQAYFLQMFLGSSSHKKVRTV